MAGLKSERSQESWSQFHNVLGLSSLTSRLDILRRNYLNHRFDRRSPLPLIEDDLLTRIYSVVVSFPPRRNLMQPGTQTIDGLFFLASLAVAIEARTVFEIGTFTGVSAWTFARNVPEAVVHTLDIPPSDTPTWDLDVDDVHRGSQEGLIYPHLEQSGNIVQHWSDSATFDFSPFYDSIDLVYIDGAHSENYVRSDSENGSRMASPGGVVVWDDYWRLSPGVVKVLHERADLGSVRVPGTRLVVLMSEEAKAKIRAS